MAERAFNVGDWVTWKSPGGKAEGKIVKVATEDGSIEDFDYNASKDDPRYIVETDEGKRAAHKADALKKSVMLRIDGLWGVGNTPRQQ